MILTRPPQRHSFACGTLILAFTVAASGANRESRAFNADHDDVRTAAVEVAREAFFPVETRSTLVFMRDAVHGLRYLKLLGDKISHAER